MLVGYTITENFERPLIHDTVFLLFSSSTEV